MTLPSDQQTQAYVKQQLDGLTISPQEQQALNQARAKALAKMQQPKRFMLFNAMPSWAFACSLFAVIGLTLYVPWQASLEQSQQALYQQLMQSDMPAEDLVLLEQLEFATWLAENEQQATL